MLLPLVSAPIVDDDAVPVPVFANFKRQPFVPNVKPLVSIGIHTPFFVSPKDDASR